MKLRFMKQRGTLGVPMSLLALAVCTQATAAQSPQVPLAGNLVPMFAQPMPTLSTQAGGTIATVNGNAPLTVRMCEFDSTILPPGTPLAAGATGKSRVWGYAAAAACPTAAQDTYIGPVIVNTRGTPTQVTWVNELGHSDTTGVLAYKYNTDQTLHWADPTNNSANDCHMSGVVPAFGSNCAQNYSGPIPAVVHLHGGEVPPEIDGNPLAYFASNGAFRGPAYYSSAAGVNSATYNYPNTQEAGAFWFHDHTLGVTRLNVNAGLAGVYYLQDPAQTLPANLPTPAQTIPIVLQDRSFDDNGQLYFPGDSSGGVLSSPNPDHPYWVPEFVGDVNVVNGKAWPFFNVQRQRYRLLFLNGSNARTYSLLLKTARGKGVDMWVIATDGGYLDTPVKINGERNQTLNIMPGERYEVIIDFKDFGGQSLTLTNSAAMPFPFGAPVVGTPMESVMQFRVGLPKVNDVSFKPSSSARLRSVTQAIVRLANPITGTLAVTPAKTRQLTLNEVMGNPVDAVDPVTGTVQAYAGGPLEVLLNNTKWTGTSSRTNNDFTTITLGGASIAVSELPKEGTTEVWEIVNQTADAHPIHLHLVQFQLINRQAFDTVAWDAAYQAAFPTGAFQPGYGPPNDYRAANNPSSAGKDGGNPDVTPYLVGAVLPPSSQERGWKDTLIMYPGDVTRIAVRYAPTDAPVTAPAAQLAYPFDPSGGMQYSYVFHCHILDHEDNEMMRPKLVQLNPLAPLPTARRLVKGLNY